MRHNSNTGSIHSKYTLSISHSLETNIHTHIHFLTSFAILSVYTNTHSLQAIAENTDFIYQSQVLISSLASCSHTFTLIFTSTVTYFLSHILALLYFHIRGLTHSHIQITTQVFKYVYSGKVSLF